MKRTTIAAREPKNVIIHVSIFACSPVFSTVVVVARTRSEVETEVVT